MATERPDPQEPPPQQQAGGPKGIASSMPAAQVCCLRGSVYVLIRPLSFAGSLMQRRCAFFMHECTGCCC